MPPPPPVNPQRLSPAEFRERTVRFFQGLGVDVPLPASGERLDAYGDLVRALLSSAVVSSSRVSCTLTMSPALANQFNTLHGGAVAAVAEAVGTACARAAAGDKEMFLGELSTAYLAAARIDHSLFRIESIFTTWRVGNHRGAGLPSAGAAKQSTQAEDEMAEGEPGKKLSPARSRAVAQAFIRALGADARLPSSADLPDAYSALVRAVLSSIAVSASPAPRVSSTITVSPAVTNNYNTLHGGAVAAVAEAVGMACARAAAGDKEMFLGELSTAYLAAARLDVRFQLNSQHPDAFCFPDNIDLHTI
nr:unnamed protein product [Digitaria exilis]